MKRNGCLVCVFSLARPLKCLCTQLANGSNSSFPEKSILASFCCKLFQLGIFSPPNSLLFRTEMNTVAQQFFPREINTFLLLLRTFPLVPHAIFHITASVFCDVCAYFYQLSDNFSALFDLIPFDSTIHESG